MPGGRLVEKTCALSEKGIIVFVEFPEPEIREMLISLALTSALTSLSRLAIGNLLVLIGNQFRPGSVVVAQGAKASDGLALLATDISIIVSSNCHGSIKQVKAHRKQGRVQYAKDAVGKRAGACCFPVGAAGASHYDHRHGM